MLTSSSMEDLPVVSDNQGIQRSSQNVLPMDVVLSKNDSENTPKVIQNFIIKRLDDHNIEFIPCDVQDIENATKSTVPSQNIIHLQFQGGTAEETQTIYNNQDIALDYDLNNSETVVGRLNQQDSVIQHSTSPVLKPVGLLNVSLEEANSENIILDIIVYSCFKCNEQFNSLTTFRQHLKGHKTEKSFACPKCSAGFNVENNLKIHMITSHPGSSDICPICKIKFQRKASLKSHILIHQVEELFLCEECHAEFQTDDELLKHMEGHAVEKVTKRLLESLVCPYCRLDFTTLSDFRQHIAKHVEIKRNVSMGKKVRRRKFKEKVKGGCKCKYCGKFFPKISLLERHERIHTGEKPYQCQFCPRAFAQKCTLQIHLDKHTGLRPYPCTLCPAKFTQKGNLWAHVEKTHTAPQDGHKMYKCSQCSCIFRKIASLNGHITKMHLNEPDDTPDSKNLIDKVMHSLRELNSELGKSVMKRDEPKLVTPAPVETGTSVVKLAESDASGGVRRYTVRQKKIGDVRWYFCNFCSSRFKKPSDLIRHFRTHTHEKPFKCSKCNQAFSLKTTLITHYKVHEKLGSECNYCDTSFRNSRHFNAHIRDHESKHAANFICVLCQKMFLTMAEGKEHRAEHEGEIQSTQNIIEPVLKQPLFQTTYGSLPLKYPKPKVPNTGTESHWERPHHCKICDARFTRLNSLKKHMLYHNGERKFKCNLCPKSFVTKYALKEHLNYHQNIKSYPCHICDKKFVNSSLLKRHLIVHNSIRPYSCPYCGKNFKTVLLCRWHIKNVHKLTAAEVEKLKIAKTLENLEKQSTTVSNSPAELLKSKPVRQENLSEPVIGDNNKNDPPLSLEPPQENSVLVTPQIPDPQRDLQPGYQMVYLNLTELPGVNSDTLISSTVKLTNDSYFFNPLSDLTDSGVLFNIETGKADMVDPNEVIKSTAATTMISEATPTNFGTHMEPKQGSVLIDVGDLTTSEQPQSFPSVDLGGVPISMIEASESPALSATIINGEIRGEIIPYDAPVICINCHKLFSDYCLFEKHTCSEESSAQAQEDLKLLIQSADSSQNKIDERIYDAISSNNEGVLCASEDPPSIQIDNSSNILASDSYENRDLVATSASNTSLDLENMKRFSYKKSLLIDVEKLEQSNEYRCKNCSFVTPLEDKYRKHLYFHTDLNDRICKFCFKEFKKPSDMRRHLRTHTGEKPFECKQCHKKFSLKSTLKSHMRTHDVPGASRIACDVCNSNFTSKSSLKVHMLLHTGARPHACTFCDQTFRTSAIRKAHEKNIHLGKNEHSQANKSKAAGAKLMKTIAEEVGEKIRQETHLDNDTIVAESLEPTEASIVVNPGQPDSISLDSVYLLQHIQNSGIVLTQETEHGSVPIDITLLDVGSLQLDDWKQQDDNPQSAENSNSRKSKKRSKETEPKPPKVECDICHKLYTSKDVLRKHKKALHGQNRKFPCIKCDKGYDQLEELHKHIAKRHTGCRPYACQYCANSFSEENSLKTHIKRIHQKSLASQETTNALLGLQYDFSVENDLL